MGSSLENLTQIEGNTSLSGIKRDILQNTKGYEIKSGDTLYEISKKYGVEVDDLITLNSFLGKNFKRNKKGRIILNIGEKINIPSNIELYKQNLLKIKDLNSSIKIQTELTQKDLLKLSKSVDLYPGYVQSVGLPNMLDGFIEAQKEEIDPRLPRIVDHSRETQVSCANLIRTLMGQSINIGDLNDKEKLFLKKQNLDAWILPSELMKIGYDQKFKELLTYFDDSKIGDIDPLKGDRQEYDKKLIELNQYLISNGVPGSLLPLFFKFSRSKGKVIGHNAGKKDKHYNTHQTMFAGTDILSINPFEIPDLSTGKEVYLSGKKEDLEKEIFSLEEKKRISNSRKENSKHELLQKIDKNSIFKKLEEVIDRVCFGDKSKGDILREELKKSPSLEELSKFIVDNKLSRRNQTEDDVRFLISLQKIQNQALSDAEKIKNFIDLGEIISIKMGKKISGDLEIQKAISIYNEDILNISDIPLKIEKLKTQIIDLEINPNPTNISLIDFLANFMQYRLDFGSAYTSRRRNEIIEGIKRFPELFDIKVDGKKIDILSEINSYDKKRKISNTLLTQDSKIDIAGPIMVDGEHQANHDEDRRRNMNSRTRFFFEFVATQAYLPTELLEPGVKSSFRKTDFGRHTDNIGVVGIYDLRRKEEAGKVLEEKITIYENLDKNSPDYKTKLQYYYSLQVKALQMYGYMQSENELNPGAFKINRAIPYFKSIDIESSFAKYIQEKKNISVSTSKELSGIGMVASIDIFPGDVEMIVFSRLINTLSGINKIKFPNLSNISYLNYPQKYDLAKELLNGNYNQKNNTLNPGTKILINLSKLEQKVKELLNITVGLQKPQLKEIDEKTIDNVVVNATSRELIKSILYRETYTDKEFGWVNFKRGLEMGKTSADNLQDNLNILNNYVISQENIPEYYKILSTVLNIGGHKVEQYANDISPNSLGDMQIRVDFLNEGFNEWLNKNTFKKVFDKLSSKEFSNYISAKNLSHNTQVQKDYAKLEEIKTILSKDRLDNYDYQKITDILKNVIRIDDNSGSNIIGKITSFVLMEEKINNHYSKFMGVLDKIGEGKDLLNDTKKMQSISKIVAMINNRGERSVNYMLFDNFVYRFLSSGFGVNLQTQSPHVDITTFIKNKEIPDSIKETLRAFRGYIEYDKSTMKSNISDYISQTNIRKNLNYTQEELDIINELENFIYSSDVDLKDIFEFMNKPNIKKFMQQKGINSSIIPTKEEFTASDFQKGAFDYVNKMF